MSKNRSEKINYFLVKPPWEVFQRNPTRKIVLPVKEYDGNKGKNGIEFPKEGGIYSYFLGKPYPFKGFHFAGAVKQIAIFKKLIAEMIRIVYMTPIKFLLPLIPIIPQRIIDEILFQMIVSLAEIGEKSLKEWYFQPRYFCKSGRELYRTGMKIAENQTDPNLKNYLKKLTMIICTIWEFDLAYRLRFQDIFGGELKKENLAESPEKEIERIFKIMSERENTEYKKRWKYLGIIIAKLIKKSKLIRKLITETLMEINQKEIELDEGDIYWGAGDRSYNLRGKSFKERLSHKEDLIIKQNQYAV